MSLNFRNEKGTSLIQIIHIDPWTVQTQRMVLEAIRNPRNVRVSGELHPD
jgi:hypothetical protein